jgi:hypothetical protein
MYAMGASLSIYARTGQTKKTSNHLFYSFLLFVADEDFEMSCSRRVQGD